MLPTPPRAKNDLRLATDPRRALWKSILTGALFAFLTCVLLDEIGVLDLIPPLRGVTEVTLVFLLLGAVIGALRREKWLQVTTVIAATLWLIVAFSPLASWLVRRLPEQAKPSEIARGADAVVVLSSRIQNDGDFTNASLQRLMRGLELVRGGHAPILVLTEVRPPNGSYTVAAKTLTANLKIPINLITIKGTVRDTHDEAVAVAQLAKQRGWKRIFLVTSPTHTRRASLVFRHTVRAIKLTVLPVASQETEADLQTLDNSDDRRSAFAKAIYEIIGIQIYRWRGWT